MKDVVDLCLNCDEPLDHTDTNRFENFCCDHCYFAFQGDKCEDKECPFCEAGW